MDFPIVKKLFHLVLNPQRGARYPTGHQDGCRVGNNYRRVGKWRGWNLVLFGFDEKEEIVVIAATSTFNSFNNPEQTTQRYVNSIRNGSHHFWISRELNKCQNLALDRNWWSSKAVSLRNASCTCYFSAQFFQCASGHSEGAATKQTVHWFTCEGPREAILFCELAVTDFFAVDLELV